MLKKTFLLIAAAICCISALYAQEPQLESGMKFDFNAEIEGNPSFVLVDDYNHYLLTNINEHNAYNIHKILIRKFDQANQLLETFTQEFPKIDANTLYRYEGAFEISAEKVAIFTNVYSGKANKQEIHVHVFDKKSASFTTTLVTSYPIESAFKSRRVDVVASENGRYIGIKSQKNKTKTELFTDEIIIYDPITLSQVWKKNIEFSDKYIDKSFAISNSGKAVILRGGQGFVMHNYVTVVTPDAQEDKQFEDKIIVQPHRVVSVGNKEYLIAFNYSATGVRGGNYDNFIFYDLEAGKTIVNNRLDIMTFSRIQDIQEVFIRAIFLQNDEIQIFAEGRVLAGTRQAQSGPMSSQFTENYYKFAPARQIVLGFDGVLKRVKNIDIGTAQHLTNLFFSFGVANVKGKFYINSDGPFGLYELNSDTRMIKTENTPLNNARTTRILSGDTYSDTKTYINQLFFYIPDSRKLVLARIHSDNKMSLLSIFNPF